MFSKMQKIFLSTQTKTRILDFCFLLKISERSNISKDLGSVEFYLYINIQPFTFNAWVLKHHFTLRNYGVMAFDVKTEN